MKCKSCGATFDGDTCPYCGTIISPKQPSQEEKIEKYPVKGTNYVIVESDDRRGLYDVNNQIILPIEYDSIFTQWGETSFLKDYGFVIAGKDTTSGIYNKDGKCLFTFHGYFKVENRQFLFINHNDKWATYSIFNMESHTILWEKIGSVSTLFGRYRYSKIGSDVVVLDRNFKEVFRFSNVRGIDFKRELNCILVKNNDNTVSLFTPQFQLLASITANYDIKEIVNNNYIVCSYFAYIDEQRIHSARFYGVYDAKSQSWLIPMEYESVKFNTITNEFEVGKPIKDIIADRIDKESEEQRLKKKAKGKDILKGCILCIIGIILLILFIVNLESESVTVPLAFFLVGGVLLGFSVYFFGRNND